MKYKKIALKKKLCSEDIFLVAFDIYMFFGIISVSMFADYFYGITQKVMAIVCSLLLFVAEFRCKGLKLTQREVILLVMCLLLFCTCYMRNPVELAIMYLFLFCARNYNFKRIALHAYYITIVLLSIIIFSAHIGIIKDFLFEGYRHGVGFRYVLFGPSLLLNCVMIKVYSDKERLSWLRLMIYTGINIWLYLQCHAELSCGLTEMLLLYVAYEKSIGKYVGQKELSLGICRYSFAISIIISFAALYLYANNTSDWFLIDRLVSGRLQLSLDALAKYPLSIFGNNVEWVGNSLDQFGNAYTGAYYYVDNAYINLLIESGIIASCIMWGLYIIAVSKFIKLKEWLLVVCFSVLSVYFIFDNLKLKLVYNTFVLLLPMAFMKVNKDVYLRNRST